MAGPVANVDTPPILVSDSIILDEVFLKKSSLRITLTAKGTFFNCVAPVTPVTTTALFSIIDSVSAKSFLTSFFISMLSMMLL